MTVYGELPDTYPVCIYDLWSIDKDAYIKANIPGRKLVPATEVKEGDLFEGLGQYGIYHGSWKPLPDYAWVEIAHTAFPTELKGYWIFRARGTGIWYNIGKTKVFPTPADPKETHQAAINFLKENCSVQISRAPPWPQVESDVFGLCAREKGLDSIQFEPQAGQKPVGTFGLTGAMEMVLVNIDGKYNCGVEDSQKTPLREGWMASHQCDCENYAMSDSCGLMSRAPFPLNITGTTPPLCKEQEGHPGKSCDPSTCQQTKCRASMHSVAGGWEPGSNHVENVIV